MVKSIEIEAKSILTKHKFRDNWLWERYAINPYRGCQFACNYCDAVTEKYLVHEDFRDFSRVIYIKKNAPERLEKEVRKARPDVVAISGVTDPYQHVERKYELTRRILEILANRGFPVHIGTKSDLVLRDVDILQRIAEKTWCTVTLTIITFNHKILRHLEPFAPSPETRLETVKRLNEEGIQAGVNFTPIVPYLLDDRSNIEEVIRRTSKCARYVLIGSGMTLRSNQRIRFLQLINEKYPELLKKYENLYGQNISPPRDYTGGLNREAFEFCRKFNVRNYIPPPSFERPLRENFDVANHLLLIAFFKEFKSANPYSAWTYHKASQQIEELNESVKDVSERGELDKISGVGKTITEVVKDFLENGTSKKLKNEMSM